MKKLSTIQKEEKLNEVFSVDEIGPGGANHLYMICKNGAAKLNETKDSINVNPNDVMCTVQLQKGPRKDENSENGVIDTDLLEIVRDRLKAFQAGSFASEYNAKALEHIEEALMWLNRRVEDRIERNVLGTYKK